MGKTSLAEGLAKILPDYELVPEPYYLLEEDGHEFAEMPVIFDRCPLDIVGYLVTHRDADSFQIDDWMPRIRESVARLDLIAFIPIEEPDRIAVPRSHAALRAEVDTVLRDIVVDDAYGLGVEVIAITGTPAARVLEVTACLRGHGI